MSVKLVRFDLTVQKFDNHAHRMLQNQILTYAYNLATDQAGERRRAKERPCRTTARQLPAQARRACCRDKAARS